MQEPTKYQATLRMQLEQISKDVKLLLHHVTGNGSPERGILLRLDRIEQKEKARSKWTSAAIIAGTGAIATSVWSWITGH